VYLFSISFTIVILVPTGFDLKKKSLLPTKKSQYLRYFKLIGVSYGGFVATCFYLANPLQKQWLRQGWPISDGWVGFSVILFCFFSLLISMARGHDWVADVVWTYTGPPPGMSSIKGKPVTIRLSYQFCTPQLQQILLYYVHVQHH
jgi:hypothetical protein